MLFPDCGQNEQSLDIPATMAQQEKIHATKIIWVWFPGPKMVEEKPLSSKMSPDLPHKHNGIMPHTKGMFKKGRKKNWGLLRCLGGLRASSALEEGQFSSQHSCPTVPKSL